VSVGAALAALVALLGGLVAPVVGAHGCQGCGLCLTIREQPNSGLVLNAKPVFVKDDAKQENGMRSVLHFLQLEATQPSASAPFPVIEPVGKPLAWAKNTPRRGYGSVSVFLSGSGLENLVGVTLWDESQWRKSDVAIIGRRISEILYVNSDGRTGVNAGVVYVRFVNQNIGPKLSAGCFGLFPTNTNQQESYVGEQGSSDGRQSGRDATKYVVYDEGREHEDIMDAAVFVVGVTGLLTVLAVKRYKAGLKPNQNQDRR
jgi:hypothetical protein